MGKRDKKGTQITVNTMRNGFTNFLQIGVIVTGIVYLLIGLLYLIDPYLLGKLLTVDVNEDLKKQISQMILQQDFLILVFIISKAFSALLLCAGLSMILPLFDPLKYRGLVYTLGVFYPLITAIFIMSYYVSNISGQEAGQETGSVFILVFGLLHGVLFLLNLVSLLLTRKNAQLGIE